MDQIRHMIKCTFLALKKKIKHFTEENCTHVTFRGRELPRVRKTVIEVLKDAMIQPVWFGEQDCWLLAFPHNIIQDKVAFLGSTSWDPFPDQGKPEMQKIPFSNFALLISGSPQDNARRVIGR